MKKLISAICSLGLIGAAAAQQPAVDAPHSLLVEQAPLMQKLDKQYQQVQQQFAMLSLEVKAVSEAPVDGLLQVFTNKGLFFTSPDGKYFIEGKIYDLQNRVLLNDGLMQPYIKSSIQQMSTKGIEYKAKDEKYVVNVFTDPTCGYCRKLHSELQDYNDAGITVRYLAYPRGGLESPTYLQMQHIWCSKDSKTAMTDAKNGKKITPAMCDNPVKDEYQLGESYGINGTPAIVLPSGRLIPGYQPAKALLALLQSE